MITIDCIADLHGHYPKIEGGDLLIVAGDLTADGEYYSYIKFCQWLEECDYKQIIIIGGNHDNALTHGYKGVKLGYDFSGWATYLCDSGTEFQGLKIWGSPWTRTFEGMNPNCKAFTVNTEEELAKKWELIPINTDILITHSPPFTILDMTIRGEQVGSPYLMAEHMTRIRPQLWVWGHIHEAYGTDGPYHWSGTKYVNASHVNERYEPVNKPIRVIL